MHVIRNGTASRAIQRVSIEPLELRLLMHANPVLDAEHAAVMALVADSAATYKSVASGNWSNPASWNHLVGGSWTGDGTIPNNGANVIISAGNTITVDGDASKGAGGAKVALHTIRDDGTLNFNTHANTQLLVDTIVVAVGGRFEMGTQASPIDPGVKAKLVFADSGDIDLSWDPLQFSRGMISHGSVSVFGADVESFIQLNSALAARQSVINLGSLPHGWKVGDRLIITGDTATNSAGVNQDEEFAIKSISGSSITLGASATPGAALAVAKLKYNHSANSVYIANVSRNAIFQSESVAIGDNTVAHRGHVMFMHNPDVGVNNAGFYGLGRTDKRTLIDDPVLVDDTDNPGQKTTDVLAAAINNIDGTHRVYVPVVDANGKTVLNPDGTTKLEKARTGLNPRGRYAVHFHRTGTDADAGVGSISGSAVVDSPGWGIVNHSSNVDVADNVVYNALGASYVTEAGDELGTFDHNIAIHSRGSGEGIESRKHVQDFGHQGDGFWLQGGNVSLTNNVVAGQRHSGYVFFPVGLNQKGLGVTTIEADSLVDPAWANGRETVAVGDVPLRQFDGNVAFASADGFESWFSLLNVKDSRRTIVNGLKVWNVGSNAIFTPYTNQITFSNTEVHGVYSRPRGVGFARNHVTRSVVYDNVLVYGYEIGIDIPINGNNVINGGAFGNITDILIQTAQDRGRTVDFVDDPDNQLNFLPLTSTQLNGRTRFEIKLLSNFNPFMLDITDLFNPDVIRMGTVRYNGLQLYYLEQAADFVPFKSATAAAYVPAELIDKTNQQIYDQYGLAIGGIVAPADASASDSRINALIGSRSTYDPDVRLLTGKYVNPDVTPYKLVYRYQDATNPLAREGWVTVKEKTVTTLHPGWNVVTRQVLGHPRSLLVYADSIAPTFQFATSMPTTINKADIDNGSNFVIEGNVLDDSFGRRHFYLLVKLNDARYISALQTRADGSQFVTLSFPVRDFAGNTSTASIDLTVTANATLQKDIGRKNLPTIIPSVTLLSLLSDILMVEANSTVV